MNALILVDVQNDFVPGGALAVPGGDEIIPLLNRLQPLFDLVVATQDWHPASHRSFATNHPQGKIGDVIHLKGLPQILWPTHCVQRSRGADFVPGLNRERWARVFTKGMSEEIDSYSGFFDNGHRAATGLDEYLKEEGVDDVYIVGLATDYCVKFTALDAVQLGLRTTVIQDACRGVDLQPGDSEAALQGLRKAGVATVTADALFAFPEV